MKHTLTLGLILCAACSASSKSGNEFDATSTGAGAASGSTGSFGGGMSSVASGFGTTTGTDTGSTGAGMDCSAAATYVYVLSEENDLYSFQPDKKIFTKIGTLSCNAGSAEPNSMAVDRNAVAWVNYTASDPVTGADTAGSVFKVSTTDASCQSTNVQLNQGWYRLGMGFSSDTQGGTSETLFVAGTGDPMMANSPGLGKIDTSSGLLSPIGQFTGGLNGQSAELTGTGDARLFGFFTTTPVNVAQLDKTSGAVTSQNPLAQVEVPSAWAFSFWGGDFYLYTCPDPTQFPTRTTNVTHYSPSTNTVDTQYMTNIGFIIVGAGVSTCAPTTQPK